MSAFPLNPTLGQTFTLAGTGYTYTIYGWQLTSGSGISEGGDGGGGGGSTEELAFFQVLKDTNQTNGTGFADIVGWGIPTHSHESYSWDALAGELDLIEGKTYVINAWMLTFLTSDNRTATQMQLVNGAGAMIVGGKDEQYSMRDYGNARAGSAQFNTFIYTAGAGDSIKLQSKYTGVANDVIEARLSVFCLAQGESVGGGGEQAGGRETLVIDASAGGNFELDVDTYETFFVENPSDTIATTFSIKAGTTGTFNVIVDNGGVSTAGFSFPGWDLLGDPVGDTTIPFYKYTFLGVAQGDSEISHMLLASGSVAPDVPMGGEVVFLGDFGEDTDTDHAATAAYVVARDPDIVELVGDNGYNTGLFSETQDALTSLSALITQDKVLGVAGNHDYEREDPVPGASTSLMAISGQAGWKVLSLAPAEAEPASWQDLGFDDALWPSHTSIFSYGESSGTDDNTVDFGGNSSDKDDLYLARYVLNVAPASIPAGSALYCEFTIDAACSIYINGTKILDFNRIYDVGSLPNGSRGALATVGSGSAFNFLEGSVKRFYCPASLLVDGDNIITARIYQEKGGGSQDADTVSPVTSSDMRFGFGCAHTTDFPAIYTSCYGSAFLQYIPHISSVDGGNPGRTYTQIVNGAKIHHIGTSWDNSFDHCDPAFTHTKGYQAEWLRNAIDPNYINCVVMHHSFVSTSNTRAYADLNYLSEIPGIDLFFVGHDHQDAIFENTDNEQVVVQTSLTGRPHRANDGLSTTAPGNWVVRKAHDNTTAPIITVLTTSASGAGNKTYKIEKIYSSGVNQGQLAAPAFIKTVT